MDTTAAIGTRFVELCYEGKFEEAGETYWAEDVVSLEPMDGPMARLQGKDAVRKKGEWWVANHEVHSAEVHGPYVNGDQFAAHFAIDVTEKAGGQRRQMKEVGLYTVKDGKIVEERFFFGIG
jgi:ketosteroid isomerase-like protein